jgi:hypothetical protein
MLWKLALAIALAGAIIISASARAPRGSLPRADLRRLLLGALALYGAGLFALLEHRGQLAMLLAAAGILTSTLAAWLSRGHDDGGPPRGEEPVDQHPPPGPETFDWDQFEREFRAYLERSREPVRSS